MGLMDDCLVMEKTWLRLLASLYCSAGFLLSSGVGAERSTAAGAEGTSYEPK
jgi:hypothetical protein